MGVTRETKKWFPICQGQTVFQCLHWQTGECVCVCVCVSLYVYVPTCKCALKCGLCVFVFVCAYIFVSVYRGFEEEERGRGVEKIVVY